MRTPLFLECAVLAVLALFPAQASALPSSSPFEKRLSEVRLKAKTAYLARLPLEKAVTPQDLKSLEAPPGADSVEAAGWEGVERLEKIKRFLAALQEASDVQKGTGLREDRVRFLLKFDRTAIHLSLEPLEKVKAEKLYLRKKEPGSEGAEGAAGPDKAALEKEKTEVEKLLSVRNLPPQMRAASMAKAQAIAELLKGGAFDDGPGASSVQLFQGSARMSPGALKALSSLPGPGPNTLKVSAVPSPLSFSEQFKEFGAKHQKAQARQEGRQQKVLEEAKKLVRENPGAVGEAYRFWDGWDKEKPKDESAAGRWWRKGVSKTMKGVLTFSGLKDVEESAGKLGCIMDNKDVSSGAKWKQGGVLAFDSAMSAMTFLPAASGTARLIKGEKFISVGSKAGAEIKGFAAVSDEAAGAVAKELKGAVAKTAGKQASRQEARTVLNNLKEVGKKYGIEVVEDRSLLGMGMSGGGPAAIVTNTRLGAAHEVTHTLQQLQLRASLVEDYMLRNGISGRLLNPAEMKEALKGVKSFEKAIIAFEKGAGYATKSGNYKAGLLTNISAFEKGVGTGRIPALPGGFGLDLYSRANYLFGFTTAQGLSNAAALSIGTYNTQAPDR